MFSDLADSISFIRQLWNSKRFTNSLGNAFGLNPLSLISARVFERAWDCPSLAADLDQEYFAESSLAADLDQEYCAESSLAADLDQEYFAESSLAADLDQEYFAESSLAADLDQEYFAE